MVLASTFITLFTSTFQLFEIYKNDVSSINQRLDEISDSYADNIATRVWVANQQELDIALQGIIRLPDIEYVRIYEDSQLLSEMGVKPATDSIDREYPLTYLFRGKLESIGVMKITASLSSVYQHLIDQALTIIISNAIKTFLISGFMLFLFYKLVARHLHTIAEYAEEISIGSLSRSLQLDRRESESSKPDELDLVVDSFHSMQRNLETSVQQLARSEQNLSQTLDCIGDAVIATDKKGIIVRMNPVAETLTGWTIDEARGKLLTEVFSIVNSQTRKPVISPVEQVFESGKVIGLANHTILLARDGHEYQISNSAAPITNSDGEVKGVILVFRNVTDEYHLQETIKNNEQRLQAIMNNSPAAICVKDLDGRFVMINREYEKLLDTTNEEIIGKTTHDIFPADIADEMVINDQDVLGSRLALHSEEKMMSHDGVHIYSCAKFCLFDSDNEPYALCSISTDVTEQRKQNELLRRSQKMDALGKLTGGVAHDFNNMLNIIIGYAEILRRNLEGDASNQHFANEIKDAGHRGANLTRKLLSFSGQASASDKLKVNLNEVLEEDQSMLEKTLTARVSLNMKLDKDLWLTRLDKGELEDAILNLSINAMHAMPNGGKLTYVTLNENLSAVEADNIGLPAPGSYVRLSISDTGTGMDDQTINKIFDPFFTTKGDQGTGLGLSQVYGFMERSGGSISVRSDIGQGTEFSMYFPVDDSGSDQDENKAENEFIEEPGNVQGSETILIVDDEAALLELGRNIFQEQGYKVYCAEGADSALWVLSRNKVDVMVSDVIMPGDDGYDLARKVEKLYPDVKIQLVSGYAGERGGAEKDNPYTKTLIDKPYSAAVLLDRVRTLLDGRD